MKKNVTIVMLANALSLVSGVVTSLLTAWALGVEGRGDLAIVVLYPNIVALAFGLGMPQAMKYFSAREPEKLSHLFSNSICFGLVMGLIALFAAEAIVPLLIQRDGVSRSEMVIWLVRAYLINIPFALLYDLMAGLLEGSKKFKLAAISRIMFFAVQCVGFAVLWLAGSLTVQTAALTMVVAQLANTLAAGISVLLVLKPQWKPSFSTFKETIRFGLKYHFGVVTSFTTLRLDQMMLGAIGTSAEMGLYVIAVRLSEVTTVLASAVGDVLMPEVASDTDSERPLRVLLRSLRQMLYVYVLLLLPLLIAAPFVLQYTFGPAFVEATDALRILLLASMIWSAGSIINSGLNGFGYPGLSTTCRFASAAVTVVTLLVWLPRYGIVGAALSSLAGYSAMFAVALFWLVRKKELRLRDIFAPRKSDIPFEKIATRLSTPKEAVL